MNFTPRPYQAEAIAAGVDYFHSKAKFNAIEILPTGSGKSVVIANICKELNGLTVVLQPSKEILEQNFAKFISYGFRAGIYSASTGNKHIEQVTFCTIGSIIKKLHLFKGLKYIIIDECDLVNPQDGMYHKFIHHFKDAKVLGLTATPYRLSSGFEGAMLKFITRTSPRIFNKVIYSIQNKVLFDAGHLCKLEYFPMKTGLDRGQLELNSSGTDFTENSLKEYYTRIDFPSKIADYANRLLAKRKNLLVFCTLISEAKKVAESVPGAVVITGETEASERSRILKQFKSGVIRCLINVGVLTVGFDFPALDTILMARSTMSLRLYYQILGRAMRPYPEKQTAWIVDLGGNIQFFGRIETMELRQCEKGLYSIWNMGKQLTNVAFTKS